jgi:hypothetical protein
MADDDAFKLDRPSARRVDRTIRKVLGPQGARSGGGMPRGEDSAETAWARLKDADASDPVNYSWAEVYQDDAGDWHEIDGGRSGTASVQPASAVEPTSNYYADDPDGDVVLLRRRNVRAAADGTWSPGWVIVSPTVGLFAVKVEKDGGSNGDAATAASYTYTVRTLYGRQLGTAVGQSRPRPKGTATYQAGSDGYGLAFWEGDTLILWDAGEIVGTETCS